MASQPDDLTADHLSAPPSAGVDATAPTLDIGPRPGDAIRYVGDYEILKELARGGMGVVFEARQVSLGRRVAVKLLLKGTDATDDDRERFTREAHAAAALEHPHIVPIFEIGEHEGQPFFSMAFLPGGSLKAAIADGPLPARRAASLLKPIAEAVHAAHAKGILHRDIKPHNILLDADGTPKLTDFGLAKRMQGEAELTGTGQLLGTPQYMPPEQAKGGKTPIGPPADVYSLGATLYALVTGRPPFQGPTGLDTVLLVLDGEPVPPRSLNPAVPRDLETITLKCLSKEPAGRYATAAALAEDVRRFLADEPILAKPTPAIVKAWKWARRNAAVAVSLAAVLLTFAAAAGVSLSYAKLAEAKAKEAADNAKAARAAEAKTAKQLDRAEGFVYARTLADAAEAWKNNDAKLAHRFLDSAEWKRRGWEHDYLWTQFHAGHAVIKGHGGLVSSVAWSPDGRRLASGSNDDTVRVWDAASGTETLVLKGHTSFVTSVAWSPDGRRLASASWDNTVRVWDAASGTETLLLKGHTNTVRDVAWSPDGRRLASASSDNTVRVWDAASGAESLLLKGHTSTVRDVAWSPDGRRLASHDGGNIVKAWDAATGRELPDRPDWPFRNVRNDFYAVSPDKQWTAKASGDKVQLVPVKRQQRKFDFERRRWVAITAPKPAWHRQQAEAAEKANDWPAAAFHCRLLTTLEPKELAHPAKLVAAERQAAEAAEKASQWWSAAQWRESLIRLEPKSTEHPAKLAVAVGKLADEAEKANDGSAAAGHLRRLMALAPKDATLTHRLAKAEAQAKAFAEAQAWFMPKQRELGLADAVAEMLAADKSLSPAAKAEAAAIVKQRGDADAAPLNELAWPVVEKPGSGPAAVALALRQAEAAVRQRPADPAIRNTLGVAQYRAGRFADAAATLAKSEAGNRRNNGHAADLAFGAMANHKLGKQDAAAAKLKELRELLPKLRGEDKAAEGYLREAEAVVGGR